MNRPKEDFPVWSIHQRTYTFVTLYLFCIKQAYLVIVWNFELYMVPIAILLLFLWKYVEVCITEKFKKPPEEDVSN